MDTFMPKLRSTMTDQDSSSSTANENDDNLIEFLAITNSSDPNVAERYLEMANGNLEMAVCLFMEYSDGNNNNNNNNNNSSNNNNNRNSGAGDDVIASPSRATGIRAPDATRTMRLVGGLHDEEDEDNTTDPNAFIPAALIAALGGPAAREMMRMQETMADVGGVMDNDHALGRMGGMWEDSFPPPPPSFPSSSARARNSNHQNYNPLNIRNSNDVDVDTTAAVQTGSNDRESDYWNRRPSGMMMDESGRDGSLRRTVQALDGNTSRSGTTASFDRRSSNAGQVRNRTHYGGGSDGGDDDDDNDNEDEVQVVNSNGEAVDEDDDMEFHYDDEEEYFDEDEENMRDDNHDDDDNDDSIVAASNYPSTVVTTTDGDSRRGHSRNTTLSQPHPPPSLSTMFAPPIHLMHRAGGFLGARNFAKDARRWLLVNIQSDADFACHALNRDVWRDELVENLVREGFILWQAMSNSAEGQTYVTRYKVMGYPHIAILDPRTGSLLWRKEGWTQVNPLTSEQFVEIASDFCCRHSFDKLPTASRHAYTNGIPLGTSYSGRDNSSDARSGNAQKRPIHELTEEEQLEAAIRASMCEADGVEDDGNEEDDNVEDVLTSMEESDDSGKPRAKLDNSYKGNDNERAADEQSFEREILSIEVGEEPTTTTEVARVQIRMPDGKRLVRKFLFDSPVKVIYAFVAQSNDEARAGRAFELKAKFPPQDLLVYAEDGIKSSGLDGEAINVIWK